MNGPAARRLVQGIGRLIRSPTDRGVGVILDHRANRFAEYFLELKASADPVREVDGFFQS